jgi:hypothetical protein
MISVADSTRVMIDARQRLELPSGASGTYYSLPQLEKSPRPVRVRLGETNAPRPGGGEQSGDAPTS